MKVRHDPNELPRILATLAAAEIELYRNIGGDLRDVRQASAELARAALKMRREVGNETNKRRLICRKS